MASVDYTKEPNSEFDVVENNEDYITGETCEKTVGFYYHAPDGYSAGWIYLGKETLRKMLELVEGKSVKIRVSVDFDIEIPESKLTHTNQKVKLAKELAIDTLTDQLKNAGFDESNFKVTDTTLPRKDK